MFCAVGLPWNAFSRVCDLCCPFMRASLVLLPGLRLHPKRKQQVGSQRIGNDPKLSTFPSDTASCWEHHQFRHPASTANAEACQVQHTAVKVVLQPWRVQVQVRKHEVAIATSHDARPSGTLPPCILQCREVHSQPRKGITSKDLSILPERHDSSARPSRLQAFSTALNPTSSPTKKHKRVSP